MWCARCQADVAAEVSRDTRSVRCASCGTELANSLTSRTESRTRQARALLERWSQERDSHSLKAGGSNDSPGTPATEPTAESAASTSEATTSPRPPFDRPHPSPASHTGPPRDSHTETTLRFDAAHSPPQRSREAAPAPSDLNRPSQSSGDDNLGQNTALRTQRETGHVQEKKITSWASTAGQWLAYSGILGLMTGTCLVILGYFRGPESYAPTGWLITTAGQMLLFLGVVTLVSSGIEESSNSMTEQISRLDAKLIRIEQATEALRAPHSLQQFETRTEGDQATTRKQVSRS